MSTFKLFFCCLCLVAPTLPGDNALAQEPPIVIAHRGASGYLPEHTLEAVALAHGMGVDYIEQDVVLTQDAVPVVLHDIHLDTVTNVASVFPGRARTNGRFFAIDFSLEEIKQLRVSERFNHETKKAVYPDRFPLRKATFSVPTLAEEIELIQGLNQSTGRSIGICVEIKSPAWHNELGHDISRITLNTLTRYGYATTSDHGMIQCFDAVELRRIREELNCKLTLLQLIGENDWNEAPTDFDVLKTEEGLKATAEYANGIGPWLPQVIQGKDDQGKPIFTDLIRLAHAHGLKVTPYTYRADSLPDYVDTFEELLDLSIEAKVDGVFTDFPDKAIQHFKK